MAEDLQREAKGGSWSAGGVWRRHGGQNAQRHLAEGSYVETVKGWQSGWFYITEQRDTNWVAAPEFRSGIPMRLTSWKEKGLS